MKTQVLIVGAGPTGLVLALWLTRMGISVRIIDKTNTSGTTSRATVFHARNLEFYHQLGIDQKAIDKGIHFNDINLWAKGKKAAHVSFSNIGTPISPYPYALIFPQDKHEQFLIDELKDLGVSVERETELVSFNNSRSGVTAQLQKQNKMEEITAMYLAGCDGAHSTVRKKEEINFVGGAYAHTFYVADVECSGPVANGQMHGAIDKSDFFVVFPMKGENRVRLIGTIYNENPSEDKELTWQDVSKDIIERMKITIHHINWFSTYRVHHRVAESFRKDRIFLLGDAGHIHSPVGGQGMNTGVGDAINLAWKIRDVLNGKAHDMLLDTYSTERMAFAQLLVQSTDRAFSFVTARSSFATFVRMHVVPNVVPLLFRFTWFRRMIFLTMSQTRIQYRNSKLSDGKIGKIQGGDRLPWTGDNFESLKTLQWQLHCYGKPEQELTNWCKSKRLQFEIYPFTAAAKRVGLKENAVYVIRPDGYIGLAQTDGRLEPIKNYLTIWHIIT